MAHRDNDSTDFGQAEHALVSGGVPSRALVAQEDAYPLAHPNGYGGYGFGAPEVLRRNMDAESLWNALRRRWILALGMGALVGTASAILMWFLFPESSSAVASFRVVSEEQSIFANRPMSSPQAYEVLKRTQIATIKSEWLLQAALRDPAVNSLPALAGERDKVQWMKDNVVVDFPQQGEILTISITSDDHPSDQEQLVNAVAKQYLEDVTVREKLRKLLPVQALEASLRTLQERQSRDMGKYLDLAREMGSSAASENNAEVNLLVSSISSLQNKLSDLEGKVMQEQTNYMMFLEQLRIRPV